jgi:L-ribulose-5-phosphate 3-epimerase
MDRRQFLRGGVAFTAALAAGRGQRSPAQADAAEPPVQQPAPIQDRICLFTDHLSGYAIEDVAKLLEQLKVTGPDLTVRPGGLVPPEAVEAGLPKAAAACRDRGLTVPMITTGLISAADPAARPTLSTMARLGIRYYKLGYYEFGDPAAWESRIEATRRAVEGLIDLGREFDLMAGFHNHSGPTVGGALWDTWEILKTLDPTRIGFYFDPSHATIEGGNHAWKVNFFRASKRLAMVAIKDFVWEKSGGGWRTRWCPLGEGMVRWPEFFALLAKADFDGPVSLHIEYDIPGRTPPERFDNGLAAAERDLAFLCRHLDEAFPRSSQAPRQPAS